MRSFAASDRSASPGGRSMNVSRAIHRLGGDSLALYRCGAAVGGLFKQIRCWTRSGLITYRLR